MVTEAQAVREAVLSAARQMCAAARTAPKACGADSIVTAVLTDHELHALADRMEQIESQRASDKPIFRRDAALVAASMAVVLIGSRRIQRGLSPCGLCGHSGCGAALASGGHCAFDDVDLGIAIGSAAALAADPQIGGAGRRSADRQPGPVHSRVCGDGAGASRPRRIHHYGCSAVSLAQEPILQTMNAGRLLCRSGRAYTERTNQDVSERYRNSQ